MAGFFGFFDYNKPGKGVDTEAPPKHPFFLFFELVWRKLSRLVVINMLLFAIIFPIVTMMYLGYYSFADELLPEGIGMQVEEAIEQAEGEEEPAAMPFSFLPTLLFSLFFSMPQPVYTALLIASVLCYGPAMCGMTYMLRNYAREEHAWFSDFLVRMKRNFLQGCVTGVLELGVILLLLFNITTVLKEDASAFDATMFTVVRTMSFVLLILLFFMRHYMYLIIVTFSLKLRHVWKNSFIFGVLNLWKNALVSILILALLFIVLVVPYADVVLVPFFYLSFTGFLTIFICHPIVYKYMVKREAEEEVGESEDEVPEIGE